MSVIAFGMGWGETTRPSRPRTGTMDGDGVGVAVPTNKPFPLRLFVVAFGKGWGETSRPSLPRSGTMDGDGVGVAVPT